MVWLPARPQPELRGKLRAAARAIFDAPPPPSQAALRDAAEWGLPASALWSATEVDPFDVWPENWASVRLFLAASTQWRENAAGYRTGIDYTALARPERQLGLRGRRAREAFAGLQLMEAEWLRLESDERAVQAALPPLR